MSKRVLARSRSPFHWHLGPKLRRSRVRVQEHSVYRCFALFGAIPFFLYIINHYQSSHPTSQSMVLRKGWEWAHRGMDRCVSVIIGQFSCLRQCLVSRFLKTA